MNLMRKPGVQRWLDQHCESSAQVAGGVVVMAASNAGQALTVAEWPASGQLTPPLAAAAQAALQRARPVVLAPALASAADHAGTPHNRVISLPLRSGDRLLGAVALAVQADETHLVEAWVKELTLASASLGDSLAPELTAAQAGSTSGDTQRALQLQALLLSHTTLADGALAMLTAMAGMLGCDRVSLAVLEGRELELLALSGSAELKPEQALLRLMLAAMHEALDQGSRVSYPATAADPVRIVLAHAELQQRAGHALTSLPLVGADAPGESGGAKALVGALLVEQRGSQPLDAAQLALCEGVAQLIGPLVALRRRSERSWAARTAEGLRAVLSRLTRRDDPWPKLAAAGALAVLLAAGLVPMPYHIGAPVRVEGAVQRIVAAPIDGFLGVSHVRPGDTVHGGDLLVELADADLMLESRKWESALAQHENGVAAALARSDRAQFVISQGKAGEARAQLELVRQQLTRTRLVAPMDGVVIKGDLSQSLGAPVQRGDALLTLAPAQQFRLIIDVDERDIATVKPGQTGRLALSALPIDTLGFVVQRITPVASVRDGRNAFEVEARLQAKAPTLRPGLEGVAKIDAGQRTFAWIWGHRALDWLRLTWWSI